MPRLFAFYFLDLLGFGLIIPVLPFMALRLGGSPQEVTLLIATYSAALLFSAPFWGRVSDRVGRKPVLLVSFVGTCSAFLMMAFADHLWMLFAARAIAGLLSGDIAAAPAYVADITKPKDRAKAMGILGAAFGLAFTIGPALGGYFIGDDPTPADYRNLPLFSAGLSATTLILTALFLPETKNKGTSNPSAAVTADSPSVFRGYVESLRFPHVGLIIAIVFLISVVFASLESTIALWSEAALGWGPNFVGYLLAYAGIIWVGVQGGLIGPLTRRFGESRLVISASALLAVGMLAIGLTQGLVLLLIGVACLTAGLALSNPTLQSLISRLCQSGTAGGALGISQATSSLARVVGPAIAGLLFQQAGRSAPYLFGALVMLGVIWLALLLNRRMAARKSLAEPHGSDNDW
ncbi:MAG: MFS transporter [Pseudomonadota bacterium]